MFSIKPGIRRQFAASFICGTAALAAGCMVGWAAPTLVRLRQPDSLVHLTSYQEGLVVSAMFCGQMLSPLPSGFAMQKLGPKLSLLLLGTLSTISWILIYFSSSAAMLMTARLLAGLWHGASLTVVPIYIAEISEPHVRGTFGSFYMLNTYIGYDFTFIVAPRVSFHTMAVIGGISSALFLILFPFCPESPHFHITCKDSESAMKSLNWLRGGASAQTKLELELIQTHIEKSRRDESNCLKNLAALVTTPANRKALKIVGIISVMEKLSGMSCISSYALEILPPNIGPFTAYDCLLVICVVSLCSLLLRAGLTHKVGHKPLLYISSLGIGFSGLLTGMWYILRSDTDSSLNWIPLPAILVFVCFYTIGLGATVPVYLGEMFSGNFKGPACALMNIVGALVDTVITASFPVVTENFGISVNFLLYATAGFVTFLFTYFYLFETRNKSLQTIQAKLNGEDMDTSVMYGESERLLG